MAARPIKITFPTGIEATIHPGDVAYPLAQEIARLRRTIHRVEQAAKWDEPDCCCYINIRHALKDPQ